MPLLRLLIGLGSACSLLLATPTADAATEEQWLDALYREAAADILDGKPLVVQVHVPLCDKNIIHCGNEKLGDGDNPGTNLYWSTSGGFKGWFKAASGWKRVHRSKSASGAILEKIVWRKTVSPTRRWRSLSVRRSFDVYVVAFAWRGRDISRAIDRYVDDLYGADPTPITLSDNVELQAGAAAHVIAYVGHNGWMDIPPYDWQAAARKKSKRRKATIAVACLTADYLAQPIAASHRVPLLMTTSLLFAGAHSFEGAVSAFARGDDLASIRTAAAKNHAKGQGRTLKQVHGAFTNPSDRRWKRYVRDNE